MLGEVGFIGPIELAFQGYVLGSKLIGPSET
jgi:hypothetical protein